MYNPIFESLPDVPHGKNRFFSSWDWETLWPFWATLWLGILFGGHFVFLIPRSVIFKYKLTWEDDKIWDNLHYISLHWLNHKSRLSYFLSLFIIKYAIYAGIFKLVHVIYIFITIFSSQKLKWEGITSHWCPANGQQLLSKWTA